LALITVRRSSRTTCSIPCYCLPNHSLRSGLEVRCRHSKRPCPRVPGLRLLPTSPISKRISTQIGTIFGHCWLVVFGDQDRVSRQSPHLGTEFPLGCIASKVRMRPVTTAGVSSALSALLSFAFSPTLQCHRTMPVEP